MEQGHEQECCGGAHKQSKHMITETHQHCRYYYDYKWEENLLELCCFDSRQTDFTVPCTVLQMHLFAQCVHLLDEDLTLVLAD